MPIVNTIFTVAHTDTSILPFHNAGRTLRVVTECNRAATALRLVFANRDGKEPAVVGSASLALCDENGTLHKGTLVPITVGGALSFKVVPGGHVESDEIEFTLKPGQYLAVNLYYPTDAPVHSGNWLGSASKRSKPGNFCADLEMPGPHITSRIAKVVLPSDLTVPTTTIQRIDAVCETPGAVVACFGDSITQQSTWTLPLAKRLYKAYPGKISLCNAGISGNRLLGNSPEGEGHGIAGIARFAEDVLEIQGLTHAILEIGTNDIGNPGRIDGIPESEVPSLEQYVAGMRLLADTLHERGVRVYAATLLPRPLKEQFTVEREMLRQVMNDWIRGADCFDAVLDFDAVLRREDGAPGMKDKCALPDGLHPTFYGGLLLAKSIPLGLFSPEGGQG